MRSLLLLIAVLAADIALGQCENDLCSGAIDVPNQTPESFCNYDCEEDFDLMWSGEWNFSFGPCHYMNFDQWFSIEVEQGGEILFQIETDYTHIDSTVIGNHGPLEGVVMDIYQGESCEDLEFIWGTACYWMMEQEFCCINDFDPTRQEWEFSLNLSPGIYYVNIDGFGYSVGCGEWSWSEPFFLFHDPEPESAVVSEEEPLEDPVIYYTDFTGRKIYPQRGVLMIARTKYGNAKKVIIR